MRIQTMLIKALLVIALLCMPAVSWADDHAVACSGTITTALQDAINAASDGDTVSIGAGSCTSGQISWTDKAITLQGAGKANTIVTSDSGFFYITVTTAEHARFRVTGMEITSATGSVMTIDGTALTEQAFGFRLDNMTWDFPGFSGDGLLAIYGPIFGLIDHNDITVGDNGVILITGLRLDGESAVDIDNPKGGYMMSKAYSPGNPRYLYLEDNTFTGTSVGCGVTDSGYDGGRWVVRNNTGTNVYFYSHWTEGGWINSLWLELYGNNFSGYSGTGVSPGRLHGGGTGLIYNNTFSSYSQNSIALGDGRGLEGGQGSPPSLYCNGSHDWDGNATLYTGNPTSDDATGTTMTDSGASFPTMGWTGSLGTGFHTGANSATVMTNSTGDKWARDNQYADRYIRNTTDGSWCILTTTTVSTLTCSGGLIGGTGLWHDGDAYVVTYGYTITNTTTGAKGLIASNNGTVITHSPLTGGSRQTWLTTDTYTITSGWPCLMQTGRDADKTMAQIRGGSKQSSFPLYIWNNGPQDKCRDATLAGDACDNSTTIDTGYSAAGYMTTTAHTTVGYGNGDKDYCIRTEKPHDFPTDKCGTHTLTYTPWTYPYPLDSNGFPNPNAGGITLGTGGTVTLSSGGSMVLQ